MRPKSVLLIGLLSTVTLSAANADLRLVEAVKDGDKTTALSLIRQRGLVNVPEADGTTALHWAARQNDADLVDRLLKAGADVKAANRYGITPLYLACQNGSAAIVNRLLAGGADPNATVSEGETALMTAARSGSVEVVTALLDRGATIDARESWRGQTALMWAAAEHHPAVMLALLKRGADPNARSAIKQWERQTTKEPREKWLPPGGLTPLLLAAREGCEGCARVLVEGGADINAADPDGITPLISSLINGHTDTAAFLVGKGADPNLADGTGRTALYSAVDLNTVPSSNRPAPKVIHNSRTPLDVITALLDRGANPNVRLKRQQPYRTKVDRGADTMLTTGTTPFLRAARAGDTAAMRVLLAKGADPKLATGSGEAQDVSLGNRRVIGGINPLMAAAGLGTKEEDTVGRKKTEAESIEAITICLEAGLDINAVDGRGQTALHGAALQGYDEVVKFLVKNGAWIYAEDNRGFTPLDAAEGWAGGFGFGGNIGVPHPSTAKILRDLASRQ